MKIKIFSLIFLSVFLLYGMNFTNAQDIVDGAVISESSDDPSKDKGGRAEPVKIETDPFLLFSAKMLTAATIYPDDVDQPIAFGTSYQSRSGPEQGIWILSLVGLHTKIHSGSNLLWLTAGDVTGDGLDEVIGSWSTGIWTWNTITKKWTQFLSTSASMIAAGYFDRDGQADLVGVWGTTLKIRYSSGTWQTIQSARDLLHLATGDMNGDGLDEILTSRPDGTYSYDPVTRETLRIGPSADMISASDTDGDGRDDLLGIFPNKHGVYQIMSGSGVMEQIYRKDCVCIAGGNFRSDR